MGYYTYTKDPIGCFTEADHGNYFEYSLNDDNFALCEDLPHKVWVGSQQIGGDQGYRYAIVKKTVAYVAVDEDEFGLPVLEKWQLKKNKSYAIYGN
jgi:hypothetical protein|tara:strand:+ start:61 stop:348 length:288 start_codon:yes stop_codon:yes gene_type:complete